MSSWGPSTALTKEEHDAYVAERGRPATQDAMREARNDDPHDDAMSLVDSYVANYRYLKGTP